jgi:hypothetical protein
MKTFLRNTILSPANLLLTILFTSVVCSNTHGQDILPPVLNWKGKSLELIAKKDNPWITPTERSDFQETPSYAETMQWLAKACQASTVMRMVSVGKSANSRDINMVIASADGTYDPEALRNADKPLVLIQAGIHAGEIDGKDAGMMLLRDIVFGKKKNMLQGVNILFIPILNVDGHERASAYNRVNQRGPSNMGWRTNARNLNLNRDYTKLDTEEIKAVVKVMQDYDPDLYLDLHVTDGADYQYDITYGFSDAYSHAITEWLGKKLSPAIDKHLHDQGHLPGPLLFAANNRDFIDGNMEFAYAPRFSNTYGDLRYLPSILVENHSLKPYKQRVLGTYVFLEEVIHTLTVEGASLKKAIEQDRAARPQEVVLTWKQATKPDTMNLLGIESRRSKSQVTGKDYVAWLGKPVTQKIPFIRNNAPDKILKRPKAYWVPATYKDVIERLKLHGIKWEPVTKPMEIDATMYTIVGHKFATEPFEGHVSVQGGVTSAKRKEVFYPGSIRIDTNQPLGNLVMHLLEPEAPDSFFQWGFFAEIFNRTEYIEEYVIEPLARKMLANDEKLKAEFERKKQDDPQFVNNPEAVYQWFYEHSPYIDTRYLLYPVAREE